ncbi:hypothetical protein CLOP_g22926 [Closterium sp. NIES-67]|nr:hypothetical protein CLOP_g22926 [Closterium sp. NIES-67]
MAGLIAYESRKLYPPEQNYPIHDKEMLAIVYVLKVWQCYMTGTNVIVRIGHRSLQYIHAQPLLNPYRFDGQILYILQPIPQPECAWQQVSMDFVMGLPNKFGCNDAIFVVVDKLTKMAHVVAYKKSISVDETARLFISTSVLLHGIPSAIMSDLDTKFTSNFWRNLWDQFGTLLQFSSAYHPETIGQTEQANQTME